MTAGAKTSLSEELNHALERNFPAFQIMANLLNPSTNHNSVLFRASKKVYGETSRVDGDVEQIQLGNTVVHAALRRFSDDALFCVFIPSTELGNSRYHDFLQNLRGGWRSNSFSQTYRSPNVNNR